MLVFSPICTLIDIIIWITYKVMLRLFHAFRFSTYFPPNMHMTSSSSTFYVTTPTLRPTNFTNILGKNPFLFPTSTTPPVCPSEKYTPIISSPSTGTLNMDGIIRNLKLSMTCTSAPLSQGSTMGSSATKEPRPTKTKKERSECSDHNATLFGSSRLLFV